MYWSDRQAPEGVARLLPQHLESILQVDFDRGRWAKATQAAYAVAWADWQKWCDEGGLPALPAEPEAIARFLTERSATHSTSAIQTRIAAIKAVHELYDKPINVKASVIRDAWAEIRRSKGTANNPKDALAITEMRQVIACVPDDRLQERAILLVGFASAMRRSELAALNHDDLAFDDHALTITIRRSKTDKTGKGVVVCIARTGTDTCPVAALEAWLSASGTTEGAIFRSRTGDRMEPRRVADVAKLYAGKAGFDKARIGAHSLRRGCITSMFRAGGDLRNIMSHSRHASSDMALRYVQAETAQKNPAIRLIAI